MRSAGHQSACPPRAPWGCGCWEKRRCRQHQRKRAPHPAVRSLKDAADRLHLSVLVSPKNFSVRCMLSGRIHFTPAELLHEFCLQAAKALFELVRQFKRYKGSYGFHDLPRTDARRAITGPGVCQLQVGRISGRGRAAYFLLVNFRRCFSPMGCTDQFMRNRHHE